MALARGSISGAPKTEFWGFNRYNRVSVNGACKGVYKRPEFFE